MTYPMRPGMLVLPVVGRAHREHRLASRRSRWTRCRSGFTGSAYYDLVRGAARVRVPGRGARRVASARSTMTFTSLPNGLEAGDFVTLAGQSPVPQIPVETAPAPRAADGREGARGHRGPRRHGGGAGEGPGDRSPTRGRSSPPASTGRRSASRTEAVRSGAGFRGREGLLMAILLVTACDGLHTQPNENGEMPPGALTLAENIADQPGRDRGVPARVRGRATRPRRRRRHHAPGAARRHGDGVDRVGPVPVERRGIDAWRRGARCRTPGVPMRSAHPCRAGSST